jgi:CheY-like chemotaxis protein
MFGGVTDAIDADSTMVDGCGAPPLSFAGTYGTNTVLPAGALSSLASAPSLVSDLLVPGYHVHEAFSASEAVWLCTGQHLGIIAIADNIDDTETEQLRGRLRLRSGMTTPPHILSVGNNPILMSSRSLLLRNAGYAVDETYTVDKAISLLEADSIDAVLICHTVPKHDQQVLIAAIREKRRLMPVLCIRFNGYETAPRTCVAVDNDPEVLLNSVKLATAPKRFDERC